MTIYYTLEEYLIALDTRRKLASIRAKKAQDRRYRQYQRRFSKSLDMVDYVGRILLEGE